MINVRNMEEDKLSTLHNCHITTHARLRRGNLDPEVLSWNDHIIIIMTEELEEQIRKLTEVHGGMQRVRQIPPEILQSFQKRNGVWEEFTVLKRIGETVNCEEVQAALHRAQESMKADIRDLGMEVRRESRKRR